MKKLIRIGLLLSLVSVVSATATVERVVKGVSKTRSQAIKNALYEAVSQVQGVVVTSGVVTSSASVGSLDVTREEVDKSIELEHVSVRGQNNITLTQAEGLVQSYEVLDEQQTGDGWQVTVKVWVYDYQSPLASSRPTLAIWAFEIPTQPCLFGNISVAPNELHKQFVQRMTTVLSASKRFNLLDRTHDRAFLEERNIMLSGDTGLEQKARLKNVEGADYLVTGRIRRCDITTEHKPIPTTGLRSEEYRGHFVAEVQLLIPATRQIAFSHEYRIKLENAQVKALADDWRRDERDFDQIKDAFLRLAIGRVVEDVLNDLSPVRVAVVQNGQVILDQGGDRVRAGHRYHVFAGGQEVRDPQTQELLGRDETQVATVEITRILPRFCYGRIVEGQVGAVAIGQVCRLDPDSAVLQVEPVDGMKSRIERTPSGGVRLPFD